MRAPRTITLAAGLGMLLLTAPWLARADSQTWSFDADWSQGVESNVNHSTVADQLQLDADAEQEKFTPFIWIANSGADEVAKIDTRTGDHYSGSPYAVCDNPSRTAVDVEGNCWVACRGDGRVMKLDADNGNILVDVAPGGTIMRAVAIDPQGYVWIGGWDANKMYKISPNDGHTILSVDVTCPYGAAADRDGNIWAVGSWCGNADLGKVTLLDFKGVIQNIWDAPVGNHYGVGIDAAGHAWVASWHSKAVSEYSISNTSAPLRTVSLAGVGRGVAVDQNDDIWVALSNNTSDTNQVAKLDRSNGFAVSYTNVGNGPVGVAVDDQNFIWAVNMASGTVSKVRSSDGVVVGTYNTGDGVPGNNPYTYSDMTGFQLQSIAKPAEGTWIVKYSVDCTPDWHHIFWNESTPAGTDVVARVRTAQTEVGLASAGWTGPYGSGDRLGVDPNPWVEILLTLSSFDAATSVPVVYDLTLEWDGIDEVCDGWDNDCDESVDEGLTRSCVSICGQGEEECVGGEWVNCDARTPVDETCNNVDDDCDGSVDEGLTQPCENDCGAGTEECEAGEWVNCTAPGATDEVCDGLDNDCDGEIDEGVVNACGECGPEPVELCDGLDNDCDGATDEDFADLGVACDGPDGDECENGVFVCTADGTGTECGDESPADIAEICDYVDNDCDGETDEGFADLGAACDGPDGDECANGTYTCTADGAGTECVNENPTDIEEACDGLDNDCDGEIDEGCACIEGQSRECGTDEGECQAGTQFCQEDGTWGGCEGDVGPTDEVCDGLDNDCDGETDEIDCACLPGETRACGTDVGVCQPGIQHCDATGQWEAACRGEIGPSTEICDCLDNDCDGETDEGAEICEGGSVCVACACAERCQFGECPAGLVCEDGFCVPPACATDADCEADEECEEGRCFTSCDTVECDPGYECRLGECHSTDCALTGCPEGQSCVDGACVPNPCAGVTCPEGQFCREGDCLPSCADVSCADGQKCVDGDCVPDPCAACDPATEVCRNDQCIPIDQDPCRDVECPTGLECQDGLCVPEPCTRVGCPEGQTCEDGQCVYGDLDGDGIPDPQDDDDDGDGIPDDEDQDADGEDTSRDHDNDGVDDEQDADDDNDGIPDNQDRDADGEDTSRDHDNDGQDDGEDPDDDNDGIVDEQDVGPDGEDQSHDHDNDGQDDAADNDDDNDGTPDGEDVGPDGEDRSHDHDNDGTPDGQDPDDDNDGTPDGEDVGPDGEDRSHDTDNDGQPNATDPDDDNDGIPDDQDVGPDGEDRSQDTDNDGLANDVDDDDDGDGVKDVDDSEPLTPGGGGGGGGSSSCSATPTADASSLLLLGLLGLLARRRRR